MGGKNSRIYSIPNQFQFTPSHNQTTTTITTITTPTEQQQQ